jgi:hypothetical protein
LALARISQVRTFLIVGARLSLANPVFRIAEILEVADLLSVGVPWLLFRKPRAYVITPLVFVTPRHGFVQSKLEP